MMRNIYKSTTFLQAASMITAVLVFLTCTDLVHAQSNGSRFPVELGGRFSVTETKFDDFNDDALKPGWQPRLAFGGFIRLGFSLPILDLALQIELLREFKGSKVIEGGRDSGNYKLRYWSVPVLARVDVPITRWVNPFLLTGFSFGYATDSERQQGNNNPSDIIAETKRFDPGIVIGGGFGVDAWKNVTFLAELRYEHGLRDVLDTDGKTTNQAIFVTIGAAWSRGKDSDRDGIANHVDKCWKEAEDFDRFEDSNGCPETDNDGDRVEDTADKCNISDEDIEKFNKDSSSFKEDSDYFKDEDGCPEIDNDQDLVLDVDDKCPNERHNTPDGCPPTYQWISKITNERIELAVPFDGFAVKKADLSELHKKILADIVKVLNDYPDMRLRIRGHADGEGSKKENEDLSENRADAVRNYLIAQGVDKDRLISQGEGEDYLIKQEDSEEGKKKNRRVEFEILREE